MGHWMNPSPSASQKKHRHQNGSEAAKFELTHDPNALAGLGNSDQNKARDASSSKQIEKQKTGKKSRIASHLGSRLFDGD
jgi:hypothetical protein